MRNRFGEQLERLHVEMIQMGALCEDAISAAAQALMKGDEDLARAAGEAEREIDQKEREVENLCLKLLLQQQPVARDLREISSALKMISDLERIGDQAADIAELAFDYLDAPPVAFGSRNWITPCHELEKYFFPQADGIIDVIHEKLMPIPGYVAKLNVSDVEKIDRSRKGL